jgi:DHA3 family macrolide efflux protein-like MFS transporter
MGVALEYGAVHEGPGIALVGVADHIFPVGAVLGGMYIVWRGDSKSRIATVLITSVSFGVLMIGMGFASFYVFMVLLFIWGVFSPAFDASFITSLQERVEPDKHGRIFSFMQICVASSLPLGMVVFGPLGDVVSIDAIFVATGVLTLIWIAFGKWGMKLEQA